jgi:hypothetical protein
VADQAAIFTVPKRSLGEAASLFDCSLSGRVAIAFVFERPFEVFDAGPPPLRP